MGLKKLKNSKAPSRPPPPCYLAKSSSAPGTGVRSKWHPLETLGIYTSSPLVLQSLTKNPRTQRHRKTKAHSNTKTTQEGKTRRATTTERSEFLPKWGTIILLDLCVMIKIRSVCTNHLYLVNKMNSHGKGAVHSLCEDIEKGGYRGGGGGRLFCFGLWVCVVMVSSEIRGH